MRLRVRVLSLLSQAGTWGASCPKTLAPKPSRSRVLPASRSYGYDPLGLGKDQEQVAKYRAFELLHARWAMLAAAGIIIPEGLQVRVPCPKPSRVRPAG